MTRTLQERPGLPGSARNDPPPEPVGSQIEVDRVQP
jgi:hypothetical protein